MRTQKRLFTILITFSVILAFYSISITAEYDIKAEIESIRKGNVVTAIFHKYPLKKTYFIIENSRVIGKIDIISILNMRYTGNRIRIIASYRLLSDIPKKLIRAGAKIALLKTSDKLKRKFPDSMYVEKKNYSIKIISNIDEREMILIPRGKFLFGSNMGDRDESPRHVIFLEEFYIDRFEVSNRDYKRFMDATNTPPPRSWNGRGYKEDNRDLPVLATYHEAEKYANWCGKMLPDEKQWEKAARGGIDQSLTAGPGSEQRDRIYPWGIKFSPERVNSIEFWSQKDAGADIKKRLGEYSGPLSVYEFRGKGDSIYGAVNMSGNVSEWTSSWYLPYKSNRTEDRRYGRQYKVIRGGSWYSRKYKLRVSNRDIGGVPNLQVDNIAGFRCVKRAGYLDSIDINRMKIIK